MRHQTDSTAQHQSGTAWHRRLSLQTAVSENMINVVFTEPVTGMVLGLAISGTLNEAAISSGTIRGSNVTLMLGSKILGPDAPVLEYTPGNIADGAGNMLAAFEMAMTKSGIDVTPPTIT